MKSKGLNNSIYLLKGLILAYIITCLLILFFSILLTYTELKESKMILFNTVIMIMSVTFGSIYVARKTKEKGWINGGIIGILYYLILVLVSLIFLKPLIIGVFSISRLIISGITGVIGGIIGINIF